MSTLRGFKSLPDLLVADRESDFGGEWGNIRTRRNILGNEEAYLEIFGGDWGNIRTRRKKERVVIPRRDTGKGPANHQLNRGRNHHHKARVCLTKFFLEWNLYWFSFKFQFLEEFEKNEPFLLMRLKLQKLLLLILTIPINSSLEFEVVWPLINIELTKMCTFPFVVHDFITSHFRLG